MTPDASSSIARRLAARLALAASLLVLSASVVVSSEQPPETSPDLPTDLPAERAPGVAQELPRAPAGADAFDLLTLQPGQTGYGLSVFSGSEPERFDVEILGVWKNSTPELSYVLARLSGQGLEHSGVAAGMSGSPVYIDGSLVGAVSFSFSFGLDPIAGITPIEPMRRLLDAGGGVPRIETRPVGGLSFREPSGEPSGRSLGGSSAPSPSPSAGTTTPSPSIGGPSSPALVPTLAQILRREVDAGLIDRHLELLRPTADADTALTWTASGFGAPVSDRLTRILGPGLAPSPAGLGGGAKTSRALRAVQAMTTGSSSAAGDGDLEPGDAVALVLIRGDLTLAAHGTVTDRIDESIVAFGHPIYSLGPTRLPMAESEVIAVIPSASSSFKLSNAGPILGVFDQDREAGAHGVLGVEPDLMPLTIRLTGFAERSYSMEVADSPIFRPGLIAAGALGALTSGSWASGFQGFDLEARFVLDGYDDLVLQQSFDGSQAATDAVLFVLQIAAFLELNELEEVEVEAVDLELHQVPSPRTLTLAAAYPERDRVAPGDRLGISLALDPYRGRLERRRIEVEIPEDVPEGPYWLLIGDGASMDGALQAVEPREVKTFAQALDTLRSISSKRRLEVVGLVGAPGLSVGGEVLPALPGSLRSVFGGAAGGSVGQALNLRVLGESVEALDRPLEGIVRVDLEVRRPAV